jgi:Tfp pilus assembly protein PilO
MRRHFPKPRLAILTALALAVALAAGYAGLVKPHRTDAATLAARIDTVRAKLDAAGAVTSGAGAESTPIRVADLFQLSRAMPDSPDLPDVLLQLSEIARETGVTFKSITPSAPVATATYQQLPIDLVFAGHFYDLADFLYRVRNLVGVHDGQLDATGRLYAVDSIALDEGSVKFPEVEAKLRVDAYVFGTGMSAATTATAAPTSAGGAGQ